MPLSTVIIRAYALRCELVNGIAVRRSPQCPVPVYNRAHGAAGFKIRIQQGGCGDAVGVVVPQRRFFQRPQRPPESVGPPYPYRQGEKGRLGRHCLETCFPGKCRIDSSLLTRYRQERKEGRFPLLIYLILPDHGAKVPTFHNIILLLVPAGYDCRRLYYSIVTLLLCLFNIFLGELGI